MYKDILIMSYSSEATTDAKKEPRQETHWSSVSELPYDVFVVWRKRERALNPVAIVATVDADGSPHTAPFGSVRAVTPRQLRLITWRGHDTYKNFCRDNRVTVTLLAPSCAVSVRGHASIIREHMNADPQYALVEIAVENVKNDTVRSVVIESGVTISAQDKYKSWFDAVLGEAEER